MKKCSRNGGILGLNISASDDILLKQAGSVYVDLRYCGTVWSEMFWSSWNDQREKLSLKVSMGLTAQCTDFFVLKGMCIN